MVYLAGCNFEQPLILDRKGFNLEASIFELSCQREFCEPIEMEITIVALGAV